MRTQILVVAIAGGCWLAGCSGPAPADRLSTATQNGTPRDLHLIETPGLLAPAVSDLEARRTQTRAETVTVAQPRRIRPAARVVEAAAPALAEIGMDRVATLSTTTEPAPEVSQAVVQAPPVVDMFPAGGLRPGPTGEFAGREPTFAGRDPVVIIRGGRGGVDDDCDLDRPGAHGHGIAINRAAPSFGGGVTVSGRTPRLVGRSGGGFSSRGIR